MAFLVPSVCLYSSLPVSISLPSGDFLPLSSETSSMTAVAVSSSAARHALDSLTCGGLYRIGIIKKGGFGYLGMVAPGAAVIRGVALSGDGRSFR